MAQAKIAVALGVGAAFLVAVGRSFRRIHGKYDQLWRATVMNAGDPKTGKCGDVLIGRSELRLEASHLAA